MAEAKDIVPKLQECIHIATVIDEHNKKLIQEVAHLEPSHNTIKAILKKAGFDSETTNEDNLQLLIIHHTKLVADNTAMVARLEAQDELMVQLREVVLEHAD